MTVKLINQKTKEESNVEITNTLNCLILKSRLLGYEIPKQNFFFSVIFYYIHGPIDKISLSCQRTFSIYLRKKKFLVLVSLSKYN